MSASVRPRLSESLPAPAPSSIGIGHSTTRSRARRRSARLAAVAATASIALVLGGCGLWRPNVVPMRTIADKAPCVARPDTLIVMLPGSYSLPEDFADEGFVAAVRSRGIAADLLRVDAHRGYYGDRTILERLQADVIEPARAAGYRHLWFAGISIGAFGALVYSQTHPGAVDGIFAIGPYLGERPTIAAIEAQGGLAAWRGGTAAPGEFDTSLWDWLQGYAQPTGDASAAGRPMLLLGYGVDDRFAPGDRLLGAALPQRQVATAPGGHEWAPWRQVWSTLLDTAPLPRAADCRAG